MAENGKRSLRIAIIGAGPGGLCMGIRLKQAGFEDFVILEKSDGVGGTWNHNRYPGLACDIPSHLYSFSFEIKRDWSRPYAPQPEILDVSQTSKPVKIFRGLDVPPFNYVIVASSSCKDPGQPFKR